MMIYPTIELQDGHCVTLDKGRLDSAMLWHVDPVETAKGFASAGAEWMHITDFNAIEGDDTNNDLVEEIIRTVGIPVQLGGGMRSREAVEYWIDKGAGPVDTSFAQPSSHFWNGSSLSFWAVKVSFHLNRSRKRSE